LFSLIENLSLVPNFRHQLFHALLLLSLASFKTLRNQKTWQVSGIKTWQVSGKVHPEKFELVEG
jgi:hypothetical protein